MCVGGGGAGPHLFASFVSLCCSPGEASQIFFSKTIHEHYSYYASEHNLPNPLEGDYRLNLTLRGIRRILGDTVCRKEPITPDHLRAILRALDVMQLQHAAIWAAALLMFFGMLRKSNVLPNSARDFDPARHLRRSDIIYTPGGALITIRWSKTNQFRRRWRVLPIPRIKGHPICPTQALFHALHLTQGAPLDGPAFTIGPGLRAPPLTPGLFVSTVKAALTAAGLTSQDFASHSFRRGAACFLWSLSVPEGLIRELGDWKSNAYTAYVISDTSGLAKATSAMAAGLPPP